MLAQNFAIDLLRLRELPSLMQRHPLIELGLQRRRSRSLDLCEPALRALGISASPELRVGDGAEVGMARTGGGLVGELPITVTYNLKLRTRTVTFGQA